MSEAATVLLSLIPWRLVAAGVFILGPILVCRWMSICKHPPMPLRAIEEWSGHKSPTANRKQFR